MNTTIHLLLLSLIDLRIPVTYKFTAKDVINTLRWSIPGLPAAQVLRIVENATNMTMRIQAHYNIPIISVSVIYLLSALYYLKIEDDEEENSNMYFARLMPSSELYRLECIFLQFLWSIL